MKKSLWFFVTCLCLARLHAQRPHATVDAQQYSYELELSDDNDLIKGKATLSFTLLKEVKDITIDLVSPKNTGKGMTVLGVKEQDRALSFTHTNDQLNIQLSTPGKTGETRTFEITYEGIPADGLIISNNKYKSRGFFGDNWPNRARNWIPCIDHPADKAAVEFIVTAPGHYQVVSNGVQVEETTLPDNKKLTHYKETVPISTKIMVIGVADFAVQYAGDVQCIPVYSWVYPENRDKGFYDYAQATEILPYFLQQVGPFGFRKLANVQSKTIFGGMENAGAIFYSEGSVTGTRKSESLLTHEIAHQWFGDMATEAGWSHLWLSEGFATYMTNLYFEHKYGQDTAQKMRRQDRAQVIAFNKTQHRPVVDTTVTNYMELLNANSYQKGSWVLHMLRKQLGDSTFWKGIRTYYSRFSGKNASTGDLRQVMEEVSGQDLNLFFTQWLYRPGLPRLGTRWQYDAARHELKISITQQQENIFRFPLDMAVYGKDNQVIIKTLYLKDKQTNLVIPADNPPQKIVWDPGVNLLFEESTP